jgi:predicted lactoylglutathione lyase
MTANRPVLNQINLVVGDMAATIDFYRHLGLQIDDDARAPHVGIREAGGIDLDLDTREFASQWDSGHHEDASTVVIGFSLESREAVDETYQALTGAGHRAHQPPYDAFFGARYAIVEDPDGNAIGLMSPIDKAHKFWPPSTPPRVEDSSP